MDFFDLNRFIKAQNTCMARVKEELRNGKTRSNWMWYVFPQYKGLDFSVISVKYSIKSKKEAECYLDNDILYARIKECCNILLNLDYKNAYHIFGDPDCYKLKSCMTLFKYAKPELKLFNNVLVEYFNGDECSYTRLSLK